jgi:hypothetical protein
VTIQKIKMGYAWTGGADRGEGRSRERREKCGPKSGGCVLLRG